MQNTFGTTIKEPKSVGILKIRLLRYILKNIRKAVLHYHKQKPIPQYSGQEACDVIYNTLAADKPCMIGRFGSTELLCMKNYLGLRNAERLGYLEIIKQYTLGKNVEIEWEKISRVQIGELSGLFPLNEETIIKYTDLMLSCMPNVDVLVSWMWPERYFAEQLKNAAKISFSALESYLHANPWSRVLKDKTVLVIHPFTKTIRSQYERREKLFKDPNVLPDFKLETITAVQSIANNQTEYKDWFEALNSMKDQITKINFDIAIIGCGAYAFPLASFVKEQGKKAITTCGSTQILFGIKGKRWDDSDLVNKFYNEYWVRPLPEETPEQAVKVEGGCYW